MLHEVCKNDKTKNIGEIIRYLVEISEDVNIRCELENKMPIDYACGNTSVDLDTIEFMIEKKCILERSTKFCNTLKQQIYEKYGTDEDYFMDLKGYYVPQSGDSDGDSCFSWESNSDL
jgi:hypothetical protein